MSSGQIQLRIGVLLVVLLIIVAMTKEEGYLHVLGIEQGYRTEPRDEGGT